MCIIRGNRPSVPTDGEEPAIHKITPSGWACKAPIAVATLRPGAITCDELVIPNTPEAVRRLFSRHAEARPKACRLDAVVGRPGIAPNP